MRIDLINPLRSQYEALHHFTRKLWEACLREGYQARLIHDPLSLWDQLIKEPADLTICFNGIPEKDQHKLSDLSKKHYLSLLVDPFYGYVKTAESPYAIVGCDDFASVSVLKKLGFNRTIFMPHAVEADLKPDPTLEKVYDVAYLGTFIDFENRRRRWKERYPEAICQTMDAIIEESFNNHRSFIDIGLDALQKIYADNPQVDFDVFAVLRDIELHIKGQERVNLLRAITEVPVHVFGNSVDAMNWQTYFGKQKNIIVHHSVSYEVGLMVQKQSKIVLNTSMKNYYGAHERIFSAAAAGALVCTYQNPYLDHFFSHGTDIIYYQNGRLEEVQPVIQSFLKDEIKRQEMADNGREIVMNHHTWAHRLQIIKKEVFPYLTV